MTKNLIMVVLALGLISCFVVRMFKPIYPTVAAPIMEVDSTLIIIQLSTENLDSIK